MYRSERAPNHFEKTGNNMRVIDSKDNALILRTAKLKDKKYRDRFGEYLIEGERAVKQAIQAGADLTQIFSDRPISWIPSEKYVSVNETIIKKISDAMTPQGIVAVARIPEISVGDFSRCAILDGISDPGNLGTIVRTSAACGIEYLFLAGCADAYAPKTVRSSMGGVCYVKPVVMDRKEIVALMRERNVPIYCTDMSGKNAFSFTCRSRFALAVGSEARGLSPEIRAAADETLSLKMQNVESLNAAVAYAVILYQLTS